MAEQSELEAVAQRAIDAVRKEAPQAEVLVEASASRAANVRFGMNEIESCGDASEMRVGMYVAFGKRHAAAQGNQGDDASLRALARRVVAMARLAPEDPEAMPLLPPQTYVAVPEAFDPALAEMSAEARAGAAQVGIAAARQAKLQGAGYLEHEASERVLASSTGLRAHHRTTFGSMSMTARTADATGSGWGMGASHAASGLDAASIARAACDKAVRSARPRRLEAGKYTVVLEPHAVAEILGFLGGPLDARSVDEGRSALTRPGGGSRVGEKIASDLITLRSDPSDPAMPSAPFDGEGLARRPITWIDRGVLSTLAYSRYWAQKQKKEPTASGGWHLAGGTAASIDELVAGMKRGLVVTRFWYTNLLDPQEATVTGLTRDGVFLVEDGKVVAPVNNFRFNQPLIAMLAGCEALTRETWRTAYDVRVPALRTREFTMASVSDAV